MFPSVQPSVKKESHPPKKNKRTEGVFFIGVYSTVAQAPAENIHFPDPAPPLFAHKSGCSPTV